LRKQVLLILLLTIAQTALISQPTGSIRGRVSDKQTGETLAGATVSIKGRSASVVTNSEGHFLFSEITVGKIILVISYIGYQTTELPMTIADGTETAADVTLILDNRIGHEVVVSASKRPEKVTDAPASIRVIGRREFEQFPGSNIQELFSGVQGVEFVRTGVDYIAINARGFNRAGNNKVFQLIDGRNTMSPVSTGLPLYNNATVMKEDVERIEIVVGPQAALYGPNVHNLLFNTTTKDPRKYQGTTVAVTAGNHEQFSARVRHATKVNEKWAFKLAGEYSAGKEFNFYDSVYAGNQPGAPPVYGPPVAIPERNVDFDFRHMREEAQVYYSVTPKADIIVSGGKSQNDFMGVTNGGRNQMRGVSMGFLQARFVHPNFYATVYNTWGNIGTSYSISSYTRDYWNVTHTSRPLPPDSAEMFALRPGNTFKEENQRLNAEAQYNCSFRKAGLFLVAGLSYQKESPNSHGYTLIDKDMRIHVTQAGAVLQLEKTLPWDMRLIAAARFDNHSNLGNFFSPKLALTKRVGENNFRITWAKAYSMPSIFFQYANSSGVTFGNGPGIRYIPNGSTDTTEKSLVSTMALKPEEIGTWEIGYKGTVAKKLFVDINAYYGHSKNFLSPPQSVSGRIRYVGDIRVIPAFPGTFENGTLRGAIFNTFFNYGDVDAYGVDIGLNYFFNNFITLAVNYSLFGSDITQHDIKNDANNDKYVSLEENSLNAPKNRGVVSLSFQNLCKQKIFVNVAARFVQQYDFYSGGQIGTEVGQGSRGKVYWEDTLGHGHYYLKNFDWGPLGGFTTIDLSAGYKLNKNVQLVIGITNLFNTNQMEFVGSPSIGRLFMFELKVHVPNSNTKQ
jgi:outer membrane receptor for ferrienterochelin and colicins